MVQWPQCPGLGALSLPEYMFGVYCACSALFLISPSPSSPPPPAPFFFLLYLLHLYSISCHILLVMLVDQLIMSASTLTADILLLVCSSNCLPNKLSAHQTVCPSDCLLINIFIIREPDLSRITIDQTPTWDNLTRFENLA